MGCDGGGRGCGGEGCGDKYSGGEEMTEVAAGDRSNGNDGDGGGGWCDGRSDARRDGHLMKRIKDPKFIRVVRVSIGRGVIIAGRGAIVGHQLKPIPTARLVCVIMDDIGGVVFVVGE